MNQAVPRFEFRAFARNLDPVAARIRKLARDKSVDESREVYILRPQEWQRNIKIRGDRLELKELIEQRDGLQRWRPAGQWTFPVGADALRKTILPGGGAGNQPAGTETFSRQRLLNELVRNSDVLRRANVSKHRVRYSAGECSAEVDEILVNGALIHSVAIESEDAAAVTALRSELGLVECENVSYPLAIARIMGLEPLPDEDRYG